MWDNNAPRVGAWPYLTGCVIYLVMSLVCFTGYCLPRSNVSYHAMTVLINLLSVVPLYGRALVVAALGHRAPALSRMIMVRLWLVHFFHMLERCYSPCSSTSTWGASTWC